MPIPSAWRPLAEPTFLSLWTASLVSNIGTWMNNVAAAWLMQEMTHSPLWVGLVPAAAGLPVLLLGMLAGTLADRVPRRPYLLGVQALQLLVALLMVLGQWQGWLTPVSLLLLLAALGAGAAMATPAWQATMPTLVVSEQLPQAVALNGISMNLSRALGPALGGVLLAGYGAGPVFLLNGLSFVWVMLSLLRWKPVSEATPPPRTHFWASLWAGPRYVSHALEERRVMLRTLTSMLVAAAQMALLPIYSSQVLGLGPSGLGLLYGCVGLGAIFGAQLLPWLRRRGYDSAALASSLLFALQLALLAYLQDWRPACAVLFLGGVGWIGMVTTLSTAAQSAAPRWILARILGVYQITFQGGLAVGSALWGAVGSRLGVAPALGLAGVLLLALQLTIWLWPLRDIDAARVALGEAHPDPGLSASPRAGPVRVELRYRVEEAERAAFLALAPALQRMRRRDGAFRWSLDESLHSPGSFHEQFWVGSWAEHEEQHQHVQVQDRELLERVAGWRRGDAEHFLEIAG